MGLEKNINFIRSKINFYYMVLANKLHTINGNIIKKEHICCAPKTQKPKEKETYAESITALIDKYVLSNDNTSLGMAVVVIGCIIVQDNNAGNLSNFEELLWTIMKCAVIFLTFTLIQIVYSHFLQKNK